MVVGKATIVNPTGIHARPATMLASMCMNCASRVEIKVGENTINPKDMLAMLARQVKCGTEIEVLCDGETETEDLKTILHFISSGMGEAL